MLTKEEIEFLSSQGLARNDVFDGRGMSVTQRKAAAKEAGCALILGAPCNLAGHRLRTRAGHCAQCDTKKIAYGTRFSKPGYVYIAGSRAARLVKIGTAGDIAQRERNLNNHRYGGLSDWRMLFFARVLHGGQVEQNAIRQLQSHCVPLTYDKDGRDQIAGEIIRVSFTKALGALRDALEQDKPSEQWMTKDFAAYDF